MAKKGVVIFDGEDMFINPKKAIYSKTRGESKNANSFVSARGDEEGEPDGPRVLRDENSGGGGAINTPTTPIAQPTLVNESIENVNQASADRRIITPVESDGPITVSIPRAEVPTIVVPPILPPNYVAPTPDVPTRPTPPQRPGGRDAIDPISGGRYSGDENNPGSNQPPLFTIDDGTPPKQNIDTPRYVAPVPDLPSIPAAPVPPPAIVIPDPMGGGGSPILGGDPEVPIVTCPTGFIFNADTGRCVPTPGTSTIETTTTKSTSDIDTTTTKKDPCLNPPLTPLVANHEWKKTGPCTWEQIPTSTSTINTTTTKKDEILTPATSSTTTTTTKKPADKVEETTTTSSTTTTTTKKSKNCNPPIYAAPKYYKWVDKGNCTFELAIDNTQIKDAAPAPVLPAAPGQPIFNLTLPTGGLGTLPTATLTKTPLEKLPLGDSGGASRGGGGGSPFPEEPAPIVEEPKKNYFWWYVGGALAVYLLIKRKKS